MIGDSYLCLQLAEERAKEGLRKAEQARHIRATRRTKSVRVQWLPAALMLGALLVLAIARQS